MFKLLEASVLKPKAKQPSVTTGRPPVAWHSTPGYHFSFHCNSWDVQEGKTATGRAAAPPEPFRHSLQLSKGGFTVISAVGVVKAVDSKQ